MSTSALVVLCLVAAALGLARVAAFFFWLGVSVFLGIAALILLVVLP